MDLGNGFQGVQTNGEAHRQVAPTGEQSNVAALVNLPAHLSGLETLERLASLETLNPIFRAACKREVNRAHANRLDFEARRGVAWSGMDPDPYKVRSVEEIAAEAEADHRRRNSPRARFHAALTEAAEVDPARAAEVRAEFCRSAGDDLDRVEPACAGACLMILNTVPGRAAREAIDVLAEMLIGRVAA